MMNGNEALAPMRHRSHSGPAHLTSAPDAERSAKESETPGRSLSVQRYRHARCRSFGPLDTGALRIFAVYGLFFWLGIVRRMQMGRSALPAMPRFTRHFAGWFNAH
jgi:hypothetical protein